MKKEPNKRPEPMAVLRTAIGSSLNDRRKTMKKIFLVCMMLWCAGSVCRAMMDPEDTVGLSTWQSLTEKEKIVLLTGFRIGSGSPVHSAPATTDKPLVMIKDDFPIIVKRVDAIYSEKTNGTVTIRGAIEIALMQIRGASSESITKKLEMERTRIAWGF